MLKILVSEKGFGLVYVIASLLIVAAAVIGLFISTFYTKAKAIENYHYRAALLLAVDRMELIKFHNKYNQGGKE